MLDLEDKFAITELINLYAHIIDRQAFTELDQVFTDDAVFDLRGFQAGQAYHGLAAIQRMMRLSTEHPIAHHATNIVIKAIKPNTDESDLEVSVESKGLGVGRNGRVGSIVNSDVLVKQLRKRKNTWRIRLRKIQLLTEPGSQT